MKVLETKLDEWLVKKAPYQLPENFKKGLVKAMPWLVLVGGVLTLLGALSLYQLMSMANELSLAYTYYTGVSYNYGPLMWVSLLLIVVEAVILFMAFAPLKAQKKRGWDLLFWLSLLNVVYAVIYLVAAPNLGQFLFSLLGTLIGLYLLFQIRSHYAK